MLKIKTIPVLTRIISKIDVKPIVQTLKNADIFKESKGKKDALKQLSGEKAAKQLPVGQGVQYPVIGCYICGSQFVQNHYNIQVAGLSCLTAAVTSLQSHKPDAVLKMPIQGLQKCVHPGLYINH
jgi:hypothetical protein